MGGFGPGLVATLVAAGGVLYLGAMAPGEHFIGRAYERFAWGLFVAIGILVSALSEALHRLRQRSASSRRLLETVASSTTDVIFVKDRQGCYQLCNQAAARFIGLPVSKILGHSDRDFFSADDAAKVISADRAIMARGEPLTLEESITKPGGEKVTFLATKGPVLDADGGVIGLFGIARDISERKRIEVLLRKGHEEMRALVEQAPVAIAMFDRQMRYMATSRRWIEDYGRGHSQLLGLSHYAVHPDIPEHWKDVHRQALAGAIVANEEELWQLGDGSKHWLRWAVHPWRNTRGEIDGIIILAEDINQRKAAEAEVRRLNSELEQRVRERTAELHSANAELDSFTDAVSHDLRAPLRAMNGLSHTLAKDYGEQLGADGQACLERIVEASRHMGELIDGLLGLSRNSHEELRRDSLDISAMASRILTQLAHGDPERQLLWRVEPALEASGDARMIEVVLRNLLDNAWKYTARCEQPEISVFAEQRDGVRFFCVADNGAGFDMQHAARLFQPLQRLHRDDEFAGIGIGLATAQRIVSRHGGEIIASAVPGQGARFCFSLPPPAPAPAPAPVSAASEEAGS